jgi:hypothetical protein
MKWTGDKCEYCGKKIYEYGHNSEYTGHVICPFCFLECCEYCYPVHECLDENLPPEADYKSNKFEYYRMVLRSIYLDYKWKIINFFKRRIK